MSYQFLDGRVVTPESPPPPTNEERIAWLEARVADLEQVVLALVKGGSTHAEVAAKLRGS